MIAVLFTLSPRLLAKVESREVTDGVDRAQRAFLRITDVTERISESRMCFAETEKAVERPGLAESMSASE